MRLPTRTRLVLTPACAHDATQVEVNGPGMSPVYAFLKASSGDPSDVEWNFAKFLLDGSGKVVKRYPPDVPPKALVKDIEAL